MIAFDPDAYIRDCEAANIRVVAQRHIRADGSERKSWCLDLSDPGPQGDLPNAPGGKANNQAVYDRLEQLGEIVVIDERLARA